MDSRKHIAIIGVGNPLYGDDGFGMRAIEEMRKAPLPEGVDLVEGGTLGVDLIEFLKDYLKVVIIDAAQMGSRRGRSVFAPKRSGRGARSRAVAPSTDVLGVIELGKTLGEELADVYVVAVEPEVLEIREGLSGVVGGALAEAIAEVVSLATHS